MLLNRRIMRIEGEDATGTGTGEQATTTETQQQETGFPAGTPVKDMQPAEQAAYYKHQNRKAEDRLRSFGDITPEKLLELTRERDELLKANQSESEKAIEDAKEQGRAEVRAVLAAERVRSALASALSGRVPDADALLDLDRSVFVKGDKADTDAIKAWVEKHSTESKVTKGAGVVPSQGARDNSVAVAGDQGRAEAARRFKKST
jgi:hypothetical protein